MHVNVTQFDITITILIDFTSHKKAHAKLDTEFQKIEMIKLNVIGKIDY